MAHQGEPENAAERPSSPANWTRRKLLVRGGGAAIGAGALVASGFIGYEWPRSSPGTPSPQSPTTDSSSGGGGSTRSSGNGESVRSYVTRPDLVPPAVTVTQSGSLDGLPPYILLANKPYGQKLVGQKGLMILDTRGDVAWFQPITSGQVLDLKVQSYQGKPVLTWWHGETGAVYAKGDCYIADSSYNVIATVRAGNGLRADMHEFSITESDTALIEAFRQHDNVDLTSLGGSSSGSVYSGVVQEIDIKTGKVLFEWDSLDHVPPELSEATLSGTGTGTKPFDYFHINSIAVMPDGDLLISSRNTWALYKIGRRDGAVKWRLGGKKSDFTLGDGVKFYWQHHARPHGDNLITLFDNGDTPPEEKQSRGLLLSVDTSAKTVGLIQAFTSPSGLLAADMGSMQLLEGKRALVGWGAEPYFTAFAADGSVLLDGQLPVGDQSYRAFAADWTGNPPDKPRVAATGTPAGGTAVYASWNGATKVASWQVHAGSSASSLSVVTSQPRSGFETLIVANDSGPYFAVTALDSAGNALGRSDAVKSSGLS
ncbi:MAG: arylsulfotransferase family protein [Nocardiopsaceae bacterium]|nr:arylsulfotransferase family protein [Nocardiopsaceae bacterium]